MAKSDQNRFKRRSNQKDDEAKSKTYCRVCKKEFFGLDPNVSRKQAQANAFTHWLRHCRNTFTSELKCHNGAVWVEVNAPKRSEQDRLNDTGPPRWTCPATICDRKYHTPRSFHEHWNRIHTEIDPSLISGIVEMPVHRGLEGEGGEDGDGSRSATPSASASNLDSISKVWSISTNRGTSSRPITASPSSSEKQKKRGAPSRSSPKKRQRNYSTQDEDEDEDEDDEDEVDILTFDDDLTSTANLNVDEVQQEIEELKTSNAELSERLKSTEKKLEGEKKASGILRSKTHSLEVATFSLRDELDQERLFHESLKSQSRISQENSLREIESLREKLTNTSGDGGKAFGIDSNTLNELNAIAASIRPESITSNGDPSEASSSDLLSHFKHKHQEATECDASGTENKRSNPEATATAEV